VREHSLGAAAKAAGLLHIFKAESKIIGCRCINREADYFSTLLRVFMIISKMSRLKFTIIIIASYIVNLLTPSSKVSLPSFWEASPKDRKTFVPPFRSAHLHYNPMRSLKQFPVIEDLVAGQISENISQKVGFL